jgi:uncharacterized damage-inducible protein DinB
MAKDDGFTRSEFEQLIEKMEAQRQELLTLIRSLSNAMRNWKPNDDQRNIHEILVHIGSSECRYASRLGKKVSGPSEVTLMRYLRQSRENVLARLDQLEDAQLNEEFADGWRVPAVLDQILTHEKEHIEQIQEILGQWRLHFVARLEAERAGLFTNLLGLSEEQLTTAEPVLGWTIKDLLAHIAFWDGFHANRMQMVVDGRIQEIIEIGDDADMDAYNAKLLAKQKVLPLEQAIARLQKERSGFMQLLKRLDDLELQSQIRLPWGWRTHMRVWAKWRYQHDAEHAGHIRAWRDELPRDEKRSDGPKYLLRALLKACHKEFVALLSLLPESEWESRPVCGVWTMKDLVGHLTAWAEVGVAGLAQMLEDETPNLKPTATQSRQFPSAATEPSTLMW